MPHENTDTLEECVEYEKNKIIKPSCMFTNEQDRWLTENGQKYNRRPQQLCDDMNALFGTTHTKNSVQRRKQQLCVRVFYTEEQEEWLKSRFYMSRPKLTKIFNNKFGTFKTVDAIESKMERLKARMN